MLLCEHPDFDQAILRAQEHFGDRGLRPAIIEKDYYVTEALRAIADASGDKVIFKGGTSLSKGWNLIQRFSEDIDLFLDPQAFKPPLGKQGIDRELKRLRDAIVRNPALTFLKEESRTIGDFGRSDRFCRPDPLSASSSGLRIFRGGSRADDENNCRSAVRYGLGPAGRSETLGFRPAFFPVP
jgi:hypothetical protein